jgi:hypothetical protein
MREIRPEFTKKSPKSLMRFLLDLLPLFFSSLVFLEVEEVEALIPSEGLGFIPFSFVLLRKRFQTNTSLRS